MSLNQGGEVGWIMMWIVVRAVAFVVLVMVYRENGVLQMQHPGCNADVQLCETRLATIA